MRFLSVCSGIEAASVAWEPLGWKAAAFSEIDAFPSSVLSAHYPNTPNLGDMTRFQEWPDLGPVDVLVGGTPCQSFSVAGLRRGLADPRGNLMLTFGAIAGRYRPRWIVWENVPGVLSSDGGRDFGAFLGMLGLLGYGYAYRVLDAQYFGLAQRRKRVFVVGYSGDWRPAAAVFLERSGLRGDSAPRREAGKGAAGTIDANPGGSGENDARDGRLIAGTLGTSSHDATRDNIGEMLIAPDVSPALKARDYKGPSSGAGGDGDGDGDGAPLVAHAFHENQRGELTVNDTVGTLKVGGGKPGQGYPAIAFALRGREDGAVPEMHDDGDTAGALRSASGGSSRDVVQYGDLSGPLDTDAGSVAVAFTERLTDAHAQEARPVEALRALRDAVDEETLAKWSFGILAAFWPAEVLQSGLHGGGLRRSPQPQRGLVNVALSRAKVGSAWTVRDLWEAGCDGCPPSGWQPSEQLARELGAYLSKLPYSPSPAQRFLHAMWQAAEGARVLREALSAVQEARRSAIGEGQSAHGCTAVRRLVVEECEALQGFPRGYTLITYRKKPAADGPRYKALGNSMAVPCMRWIGERIVRVERVMREDARSHLPALETTP
jgi:DNA (cytosine-5)-methyltransferase 1